MKIIDRYILRQFLRTFAICFISLLGLYVVFHLFSNIEEFISEGERQGSFLRVTAWFYSFRVLYFFDLMSALLTVIAAIFAISQMQRHNELVALMSAGISKLRVIAPILGAAIAITVLAAASRELLIPRFASELSMTPQDFRRSEGRRMRGTIDASTAIRIDGELAFRDKLRISKPSFSLPTGEKIHADDAFYRKADASKPAGYLLRGVLCDPPDLAEGPSVQVNGKPVVLTPADNPELKQGECFVVSTVPFDRLIGDRMMQEYSSTLSLVQTLRGSSSRFQAGLRGRIHERVLRPLLDLTLVFLALPIVLRRSDHNAFRSLAVCAGMAGGFLVFQKASAEILGKSLDAPVLGAWLPLIVFVPVAVLIYDWMKT